MPPPSLTYTIRGRIGNNIFQYWMARLLCRLHGHRLVGVHQWHLPGAVTIDDKNYMHCVNGSSLALRAHNVIAHGYFQNLDLFGNAHRGFVKSIMTQGNTDPLHYENYRACDFAPRAVQRTPLSDRDLVMHVRLDDFIHDHHNSDIVRRDFYVNAMGDRREWNKIYIVTDALRTDKERQYIDLLKKELTGDVVLHQGSLLDDWHLLQSATNLIVSNSTFAWTALILGSASWAVIPDTHFNASQVIVPIRSIPSCRVVDAARTNYDA